MLVLRVRVCIVVLCTSQCCVHILFIYWLVDGTTMLWESCTYQQLDSRNLVFVPGQVSRFKRLRTRQRRSESLRERESKFFLMLFAGDTQKTHVELCDEQNAN